MRPLCILHLSDLHRDRAEPTSNVMLIDSLERDRDQYTGSESPTITAPSLVVVSGDIIQGLKHGAPNYDSELERQYTEALEFLSEVTDRFVDSDRSRVVIVPGNHDVSDQTFRRSLEKIDLSDEAKRKIVVDQFLGGATDWRWSWEELAMYRIVDREGYEQRMEAFRRFYSSFYEGQRSYAREPERQFDVFDAMDWDVTIVGFSSCHDNDLLNGQGAIHPDCLAQANTALRRRSVATNPLRLAVWHHDTQGPPNREDYLDGDVIQNLIHAGFSLGFHGHQHRPEFIDTRFLYGPNRRLTLIGAGTLCGGTEPRFSRGYNLVELDVANKKGRLHVREMQNPNPQMPIWGPRGLRGSGKSYLDFSFDGPPRLVVGGPRVAEVLRAAQLQYEKGEYGEAAEALWPLAQRDDLARRLLLECLLMNERASEILRLCNPPRSSAEAIALMDALWSEGKHGRLRSFVQGGDWARFDDPSVRELRVKYLRKLSRE